MRGHNQTQEGHRRGHMRGHGGTYRGDIGIRHRDILGGNIAGDTRGDNRGCMVRGHSSLRGIKMIILQPNGASKWNSFTD